LAHNSMQTGWQRAAPWQAPAEGQPLPQAFPHKSNRLLGRSMHCPPDQVHYHSHSMPCARQFAPPLHRPRCQPACATPRGSMPSRLQAAGFAGSNRLLVCAGPAARGTPLHTTAGGGPSACELRLLGRWWVTLQLPGSRWPACAGDSGSERRVLNIQEGAAGVSSAAGVHHAGRCTDLAGAGSKVW